MSVQAFAEASQKATCPIVTGVEPALTAAVSVTTVPEPTLVTGVVPEAIVRVVVVVDFDCAAVTLPSPQTRREDSRQKKPIFREARDSKGGWRVGTESPANQGVMIMAMPPNSRSTCGHPSRARSSTEDAPPINNTYVARDLDE
jgi:hypothetical protein